MNFNLTLIGQMISFAVFVWFTMTYVWTPIVGPWTHARPRSPRAWRRPSAATTSRSSGASAPWRPCKQAKAQAAEVIGQAQRRATEIIEQAKLDARAEGGRMLVAARAELEQETNRAREALRGKVGELAVAAAREDPREGDRCRRPQVHRRLLREADLRRDHGRRHHHHRTALRRRGLRAGPGDRAGRRLVRRPGTARHHRQPTPTWRARSATPMCRGRQCGTSSSRLPATPSPRRPPIWSSSWPENDRLALLPELPVLFEALRTAHQGLRAVQVRSAYRPHEGRAAGPGRRLVRPARGLGRPDGGAGQDPDRRGRDPRRGPGDRRLDPRQAGKTGHRTGILNGKPPCT